MKFLKERLRVRGKIIFGAIGAAFLLFLGSAQPTHAFSLVSWATNPVGNIGYAVVGTLAFAAGYILAWIAGIVISIEAWVITVVLNINAGIMSTSFVQTGFSISLSIANLAFVLGIIVIALATILRIENYSIKKMLWKLVVMAILVNFGLVIIAPIFGFSNSLTQYFLNCINPGSGGCTQSGTAAASFNTFATTMVSRFGPQKLLTLPANIGQGGNNAALGNTSGSFSVAGQDTSGLGQMLVPIIGLFFTVMDFILIIFVLGVFIVMLMIRYIYIAILAILLPFAWASWVFPSFSSMYSKWWNKFLHWTFFAPIFMFFLYLALTTIGGANTASDVFNTDYTQGTGGTLYMALMSFFGAGVAPLINAFLTELTLSGLILGGMIAADSMGIKFAEAVLSGANTLKNKAWAATKKQAWRGAQRQASRHLSTAEERAKTTAMYASGNRLTNLLADQRAKLAERGGKDLYKEDFKGMGKERAMGQLSSTQDEAKRQGLLEYIGEKGWESDARVQPYLTKKYEDEAKKYGNEDAFEKLRTKTGVGLNEAINEGNQDKITQEIKKAVASNPEMLAGAFLSPEDIQKAIKKAKDAGMDEPLFAQAGVAGAMQQAVIQSLPKLSSANVASLMNEVSKKNNTDGFTKAFDGLGASQKSAAKDALESNPDLMRWIEKSPHKTVVDLAKLYGVKSQGTQSQGGIISDNLEANFKKIRAEQQAKNR